MKNIVLVSSLMGLALACGVNEGSKLLEEWNSANDPTEITGVEINKKLSELPDSGELEVLPWADDYWATYQGGLSYRWQVNDFSYDILSKEEALTAETRALSPAEKYDLFVGREDFPLTRSERVRTEVLKTVEGHPSYEEGFEIATWQGLCHGWAPASVNFQEPKPVTVVGANGRAIEFGSADIKGLLTYYQQYEGNRSTRTEFMSERCNESFSELKTQLDAGDITQEEYDSRRNSSACSDVNAGAFHLVLTNELGLKKRSFIIDATRDAEVWNHAVQSYELVMEDLPGVDANAADGTVSEVRVVAEIIYAIEAQPSYTPDGNVRTKVEYDYILELNEAGEVIGGRWISEKRPDFIWRESTPIFRGYFKALEDIYQASIAE